MLTAGVARKCGHASLQLRALCQGIGGTPQQQCAPMPAMAGMGPPWRAQSSVVQPTTPPRRCSGVLKKNVCAEPLNPWSR